MIIEIKVTNYRSYKDTTSLSFEALPESENATAYTVVKLNDGSTISVLHSAAILGANASGKSNIIRAFEDIWKLVTFSRGFDVNTKIPAYHPFALDKDYSTRPCTIMIDFVSENNRYQYSITFNQNIFLSETLLIVENGEKNVVFDRQFREDSNGYSLKLDKGWKSKSADLSNADILGNQLLLSVLGTKDANGLQYIYAELLKIKTQMVNYELDFKYNNNIAAEQVLESEQTPIFKQLKALLCIADKGISDVRMIKHKESEFQFPESLPAEVKAAFIQQNRWEFSFLHKGARESSVPFPFSMESTGTKNLFGVSTMVLNALKSGSILVYDEMNVAMHPKLFQLLVKLFHDPTTNPHHAQLVFSTHDASIVGDSLMRADQVWFAEKNAEGVSELFSAQDFDGIKIIESFDRWYQSGRFGAIPQFSDVKKIFDDETGTEEADQ